MRRLALAFVALLPLACHRDLLAPGSSAPRFDVSTSDGTPPALTALAFNPTTINTSTSSASITVDFTVTDDLSGATLVYAWFYNPSGIAYVTGSSSFAAATSHSGSFTVDFPQFSEAGTWTLSQLWLRDAAGNNRYLFSGDLTSLGFPIDVTVESISDGVGPLLTALAFNPTTINTSTSSASITVDFTVTDDLSGAALVYAWFYNPSGIAYVTGFSSFAAATSHSGSFTVDFPQFSEAGTWTLSQLWLRDAAGNNRYLFSGDLTSLGFPATLGVQNTVSVSIDIKPGQVTNSINPTSKGNTPVAILSSADLDAVTQVDRTSLTFGRTGEERSLASCGGVANDVNGDGRGDLVCQFTTRKTGFRLGDTEGILRGRTVDQIPIEGRDAVRILK